MRAGLVSRRGTAHGTPNPWPLHCCHSCILRHLDHGCDGAVEEVTVEKDTWPSDDGYDKKTKWLIATLLRSARVRAGWRSSIKSHTRRRPRDRGCIPRTLREWVTQADRDSGIGNIPPAAAEETFCAQRDVLDMVAQNEAIGVRQSRGCLSMAFR